MTRIELPARKRVGHLTLLREARSITPKEFNALSPGERLDIVRRARGAQKYRLLIEAKDGAALMRRLPAQDVFSLIKEIGMEDAGELMQMAGTAQVTAFLDLDCWDRDVFDGENALVWLALLMECGEEKVLRTLREIDYGLLVMWLKKHVVVTGPDPDEDEEQLKERLANDRLYDIDIRDSETAKLLGGLFALLKKEDRDFYLRLMEGLCWELDTELEEGAYRQRNSRMADRGFPDPFEALGVYSYLDPDSYDPAQTRRLPIETGEAGVVAPDIVLSAVTPRDLFAQVLDHHLDDERLWELTFLLNKIMIADRLDVGDAKVFAEAAESLYRYVNIALEHLSGGNVETAVEGYQQAYLEHLFRLGFSLTLDLQRRARKVRSSVVGPYLDGPYRALSESLSCKKPLYFEGLDDEARATERPFASIEDVHRAGLWLERLETQRRLFEERLPFNLVAPELVDLDGCVPEAAEDLALSDFFLTAVANRILGRDFVPTPIADGELPSLHALVCIEGRLSETLRRETVTWIDSLQSGAGDFADYCFDLWEEEFCSLKTEELDPRYIGGLIVRVGR